MADTLQIEAAGDSAVIAYFGFSTSTEISACIHAAAVSVQQALGAKLVDLIPSYASLMVIYDPLQTDHLHVSAVLREAYRESSARDNGANHIHESDLVTLPVYYAEESGPDLAQLAATAGISQQDVIDLHTAIEYRVYAIGFAPGFAYLGQVDERIATPRLATPRLKVPRGAVAIADQQTAVYPAVSPGGWNLIGMCPTPMFDPASDPPMPVAVGYRVRFEAVDRATYLELGGEL